MRQHLMIRLMVIASILLYGSSLTASAIPFELVKGDELAAIYYDLSDSKLVARSAQFFAQDIAAVTGKKPAIHTTLPEQQDNIVLIGTLGESPIIDRLAAQHPELRQHAGDWERYLVTTLVDPFPGIKKHWLSSAATGAGRRMASLICRLKSVFRPGTGGQMFQPNAKRI